MAAELKLSHTAAMILHAIHAGDGYGFSVMEMTGLPSGTVYPAMRRLGRDGLNCSRWGRQALAAPDQAPPRQQYKPPPRRPAPFGASPHRLAPPGPLGCA